jgi:hypothetical protein
MLQIVVGVHTPTVSTDLSLLLRICSDQAQAVMRRAAGVLGLSQPQHKKNRFIALSAGDTHTVDHAHSAEGSLQATLERHIA